MLQLMLTLLSLTGTAGGQSTGCDADNEYTCANTKCIPLRLVNNIVNDCGDNSDEATIPCRTPLYSCRNNRCALMRWVLDGKDDCLDASDEAKQIGTNCTSAVDCCFCEVYVPHSKCIDDVCQCVAGYYPNDLGTICIPRAVGDPCESDSECAAVEGGFCTDEGYCGCPPGHIAIQNSQKCIPRELGHSCSTDGDCLPTIANSRCDAVSKTCVCDVEGGFHPQEDGFCGIRILGDACSDDSDCLEAIEHSRCSVDSGRPIGRWRGNCVCIDGYRANGTSTCRPYVLGDDCVADEECSWSIEHGHCQGGVCSCQSGFKQVDSLEIPSAICESRPTLAPYIPADEPDWTLCTPSGDNSNGHYQGTTAASVHQGQCAGLQAMEECASLPGNPSSGRCLCLGGFARKQPTDTCERAKAVEIRINCTWIAGRFELEPLIYEPDENNRTNEVYWDLYSSRLQHSGVDIILRGSELTSTDYLSNSVYNFDDAQPGLAVSIAVYIDFNSTLQLAVISDVLGDYFNRSDGEIGTSRIYISKPYNDSFVVDDFNECGGTTLTTSPLNDCSANASCDNLPAYFQCVCGKEYKDETVDKQFDGRYCVAIDREKEREALEQTFKNAGCTDGVCETSWDVVLLVMSILFSVLLLLLTFELIWKTRQLRREVLKKERQKAGLLEEDRPPKKPRQSYGSLKTGAQIKAVSFTPATPFIMTAKRHHSLPTVGSKMRRTKKRSEDLGRTLLLDQQPTIDDIR